MKITHQLAHDSPYRRGLRILLIGSGGNGSAVLFGLPYLHHALIAWGKDTGIDVTVMDGDTVSPTNCVRQPFGAADIGHNKATILVNRLNLFHGLSWRSEEAFFSKDRRDNLSSYDNTIDFLISCVDTRAARSEMHEAFNTKRGPWRNVRYWLDIGNNASNGQFVLGQPLNDLNRQSRTRLRTVTELFPRSWIHRRVRGRFPVALPRRPWSVRSRSSTMYWQRAPWRCLLTCFAMAHSTIMARFITRPPAVQYRCQSTPMSGKNRHAVDAG